MAFNGFISYVSQLYNEPNLFQIAFQKAISVEEKKVSIVDNLNIESMHVEQNYDGPRYVTRRV